MVTPFASILKAEGGAAPMSTVTITRETGRGQSALAALGRPPVAAGPGIAESIRVLQSTYLGTYIARAPEQEPM
jgi:hypothetical protein